MEDRDGGGNGWLRAVGLAALTLGLSVVRPGVLVALPFVLLILVLPGRGTGVLLAGMLAVLVVAGGGPREGMWYLERGWSTLLGGWFLGLTLRWPRSRFFPRALGAVAGTFGVAAVLFRVQPRSWSVTEWIVTDRMRAGANTALSTLRQVAGDEGMSQEMLQAIRQTLDTQEVVFPALLGLASICALGVAWWTWVRLTRGHGDGIEPVRDFRFDDQLVWVFVAGVALVLLGSSGAWDRIGTNVVVFMGALYALRGVAVLLFLNGGIGLMGSLLAGLALLFVAPLIAAGALVVGLGDTWLNFRERAGRVTESGS